MPQPTVRLPLKDNSTGQGLILTALGMLALGVVLVYSATASVGPTPPWYARREVRHAIFAALSCGILFCGWQFNYRRLMWGRRMPIIPTVAMAIAVICAALVFVPGVGRSMGGAHRWIRIGPAEYSIGFQPSELVKLALVVFLAAWLSRDSTNIRSFKTFVVALVATGVAVAAIVTEDFGMAAVVAISAGAVMLMAGIPVLYLLGLLAPAAGGFYFFVMRVPHRWARITAMFDVWNQSNPSTYQPRQALIANLLGGWEGRGLGSGLQKTFLPENATDFIFSVYCEECGFAGAMLLIGLIGLWIWNSHRAAVRGSDRFGRVLAGSLGFLIAMQAVLHIAVNLVVAPPTGISLPLISAGGTALVMTAAAVALIVSVTARSAK